MREPSVWFVHNGDDWALGQTDVSCSEESRHKKNRRRTHQVILKTISLPKCFLLRHLLVQDPSGSYSYLAVSKRGPNLVDKLKTWMTK